ncbi:hypothetical protein K8942_06030 [Candidatus Peribacteria bacterium]|nr:MAG: hypothetical protein K8942_06030 [Candidatus Peribacteria bacterium]
MSTQDNELEVQFKPETGKAVIEGKTVVPFQAFITLVLQKKVLQLAKTWGKHPVILDSELLTSLASAPGDSQENRSNMVMVSLITGVLLGITGLAILQIALLLVKIPLGYKELGIIAGSIVAVFLLLMMAMKMRKPKSEKLVEAMEHVASFLK